MTAKKYALAVYLLLATISIILILISFNYLEESSSSQSLFLNLATEMAGAVLIFVVVNRIFAIDEREDVEELRQMREDMQRQFSPLGVSSEKGDKTTFFRQYALNASQIDLVGYNLVSLLRKNRDLIVECAEKRIKIRFILVDIHSKAEEVMLENTFKAEMIRNDFVNALDFVREIKQAFESDMEKSEYFEIRLTRWLPSCSMILIRSPKIHQNAARVSIHSPSFRLTDRGRRTLFLNGKSHYDDIEYFSKEFENLWMHDSYELPDSTTQES